MRITGKSPLLLNRPILLVNHPEPQPVSQGSELDDHRCRRHDLMPELGSAPLRVAGCTDSRPCPRFGRPILVRFRFPTGPGSQNPICCRRKARRNNGMTSKCRSDILELGPEKQTPEMGRSRHINPKWRLLARIWANSGPIGMSPRGEGRYGTPGIPRRWSSDFCWKVGKFGGVGNLEYPAPALPTPLGYETCLFANPRFYEQQ